MPAYKMEQRGTWYCKFCYTDWSGAHKQKKKEGFRTKRDALDFEREFLVRSRNDCELQFRDVVKLYLEDCRPRLKPTTMRTKETMLRGQILPYFANCAVSKITPALIRSWQNELIRKGFAPTYQKALHNQASSVFNFAVKYYRLSNNPCKLAGSIGKKQAEGMAIWTPAEFSRFLEGLGDKPASRAAFLLLFWTGIRSGELLALTAADFDFAAGTLSITKNYARQSGEDLILSPKTPKSRRVVTLPDFLVEALEGYVAARPEGRLFPKTKHFLYHEMQRGCGQAGLPPIRVHDLRHSHASFLIEKGFSPLLIAERLGHENIQTTLQIYSHLYPNKQQEVARQIQAFYMEHEQDRTLCVR